MEKLVGSKVEDGAWRGGTSQREGCRGCYPPKVVDGEGLGESNIHFVFPCTISS